MAAARCGRAPAGTVRLRQPLVREALLERFQIIAFPGGFSYGDDIAAVVTQIPDAYLSHSHTVSRVIRPTYPVGRRVPQSARSDSGGAAADRRERDSDCARAGRCSADQEFHEHVDAGGGQAQRLPWDVTEAEGLVEVDRAGELPRGAEEH